MMIGRFFNKGKATPQHSVLVVEDDLSIAQLIVDVLEDEGFLAQTVPTGEQALAILDKEPLPDAIIVDYGLPDMNGGQLIESARARLGRRAIPPVLMLTASREGESVANASQLDDYMPKPFNNEALVAHVRKLIGTPKHA